MKKIIPPFLYLFCLLGIVLAYFIFPLSLKMARLYLAILGAAFWAVGLGLTYWVSRHFAQIQTEIHTFKSPIKLVTNGPFCISRNPIYLGFFISLVGATLVFPSMGAFIIVSLFFIITNSWYIPFEEKNMEKTFGQSYLQYKKKVRRWI